MIYDAIIIGGGPAGLACAIELGKNEASCLVLEKRPNVRGTVCGDGLSCYSLKILRELGIDPESLNGKKILYKKGYYPDRIKKNSFEELFGFSYEIGVSRDVLDECLLKKAVESGAHIFLNTEARSVYEGSEDEYTVNGEYKARKIVYACGINGGKKLGLSYPKGLPAGISARITGDCSLEDDTFHYFPEVMSDNGYAWVFPVGERIWNVGLWCRERVPDLKKKYYEFEKQIFPDGSFQYDRFPRGRIIGASESFSREMHGAFVRIGDCALTTSLISGEGISFAMESGRKAAKDIIGQKCFSDKTLQISAM